MEKIFEGVNELKFHTFLTCSRYVDTFLKIAIQGMEYTYAGVPWVLKAAPDTWVALPLFLC